MALSDDEINKIALMLVQSKEQRTPLLTGELSGFSLEQFKEAYDIQNAVANIRQETFGRSARVWKASAADVNAEPVAAPIPSQWVYQSPTTVVSTNFNMIGVEAELAFRFAEDLPKREKPYGRDEIMSAIEEVFVAIEIIDSRIKDWKNASQLWLLADNLVSGGFVQGSGVKLWEQLDPSNQQVLLLVDGVEKVVRQGGYPLGDPTLLVPWTVNHCIERHGIFSKGSMVTTGSWTGVVFVEPESEVQIMFPNIGEAKVRFSLI